MCRESNITAVHIKKSVLYFLHNFYTIGAMINRNIGLGYDIHTAKTGRLTTVSVQGSAVADKSRATRCITVNVLQTSNVVAQCDELATELSWQHFASKVVNFQQLHLHLTYPTCIWRPRWGWPCLSFAQIFGNRKPVSGLSCGVVCVILRTAVPVKHPTCDRRTDRRTVGQTDGQTDTCRQLIPSLASVARVKCVIYFTIQGLVGLVQRQV